MCNNRFQGAKLTILGDSISAAGRYQKILTSKYGIICDNHAISGASWALGDPLSEAVDQLGVIRQVDTLTDFSSPYWLLFAGTNDWGGRISALGSIPSDNLQTVSGGMDYVIRKILTNNPTARILVANLMYRSAGPVPYTGREQNPRGISLAEYSKHITDTAHFYSLPVLDLTGEGFANCITYATYLETQEDIPGQLYWLHPNDQGHQLLADLVYNGMCRYF